MLGYSDAGHFVPDSVPDAMRWLLGEYERELAWADSVAPDAPAVMQEDVVYEPIEPLLTSRWNQDDPYNSFCPTYNGQRCFTGCVATALAQIMYYHKWPERGRGSHSYEWRDGIRLSADFSQSVYDWDAMADAYDETSPQRSKDAVARLMYDVGVACNMLYGTGGSGGYIYPSNLISFFGYSKNCWYLSRDESPGATGLRMVYGISDWKRLIYESLAAGNPVYYAGDPGPYAAGHAFVLDGYRNGYFHVNWGWGGMSDGYFLITALDPYSQGIGGGSSGYNYKQEMILDLYPEVEDAGSYVIPRLVCPEHFDVSEDTVKFGSQVDFTGPFMWKNNVECEATLGIKVVDRDSESLYIASSDTYAYSTGVGRTLFTLMLDDFPTAEGEYRVYPAYRDSAGAWYDIPVTMLASYDHLIAEVEGDTVIFSRPWRTEPNIRIESIADSVYSCLHFGSDALAIQAKLRNVGGMEYFGDINIALSQAGSSEFVSTAKRLVDIPGGLEQEIEFFLQSPSEPGDYELVFMLGDSAIGGRYPVRIEAVPLVFRLDEPLTLEYDGCVQTDRLRLTTVLHCESGAYSGKLYALFSSVDDSTEVLHTLSVNLFIEGGKSCRANFEGTLPDVPDGTRYFVRLYYDSEDGLVPVFPLNLNGLEITIGDYVWTASNLKVVSNMSVDSVMYAGRMFRLPSVITVSNLGSKAFWGNPAFAISAADSLGEVLSSVESGLGMCYPETTQSWWFGEAWMPVPSLPGEYCLYVLMGDSIISDKCPITVLPDPSLVALEEIGDGAVPHDIEIYSLSGICVSRQKGVKPDISALPPGVYVVRQGKKRFTVIKEE